MISLATLRWVSFIAAIPFFYFLFTNTPPNWLYYTSIALIVATVIGRIVLHWKMGETKKAKNMLLLIGVYALIIGALIAYQLFIK